MFFGYCKSELFDSETPQRIEMSEAVLNRCRLTEKGLARAQIMLDGQIRKVGWDVTEGRGAPRVIVRKFPFWTGQSERVETEAGDDVFYARVDRCNRTPIWGRFVRGRKGMMVRHQTVIIRAESDIGPIGWKVVAAYAGEPAPPFPGDPFATRDSVDFWSAHALIEGAVPYRKGTEQTDCPW